MAMWTGLIALRAQLCSDLKNNNEYSGSKSQDILDQPKNYHLSQKDFTHWRLLISVHYRQRLPDSIKRQKSTYIRHFCGC